MKWIDARACAVLSLPALMGCPDSKTAADGGEPTATVSVAAPSVAPAASASAPSTTALVGGWMVLLRSENPSINPDMFDTPEKRARVFLNHDARVVEGRVRIELKDLKRTEVLKDEQQAVALDKLLRETDWNAVRQRAAAEAPTEGATVFTFEIRRGPELFSVTTTHIESHPELKAILTALRDATPAP